MNEINGWVHGTELKNFYIGTTHCDVGHVSIIPYGDTKQVYICQDAISGEEFEGEHFGHVYSWTVLSGSIVDCNRNDIDKGAILRNSSLPAGLNE